MDSLLEAVEAMRAERAGLVVRLAKIDAAIVACSALLGDRVAHAPLPVRHAAAAESPQPVDRDAEPDDTADEYQPVTEAMILDALRELGRVRLLVLAEHLERPTHAVNHLLQQLFTDQKVDRTQEGRAYVWHLPATEDQAVPRSASFLAESAGAGRDDSRHAETTRPPHATVRVTSAAPLGGLGTAAGHSAAPVPRSGREQRPREPNEAASAVMTAASVTGADVPLLKSNAVLCPPRRCQNRKCLKVFVPKHNEQVKCDTCLGEQKRQQPKDYDVVWSGVKEREGTAQVRVGSNLEIRDTHYREPI